MKQLVRRVLEASGYEFRRSRPKPEPVLEEGFREIWEKCAPFTMTSIERAQGLYDAVRYIVNAQIPGDFIECGVWRGGSGMIMALTLMQSREVRPIYLYDSFEGMSEPSEIDVGPNDESAREQWLENRRGEGSAWCDAPLEEVRENMASTGYPMEHVHLVKGKVERTLPSSAHDGVGLLRLDTDWYESTKLEIELLYPKLARGGILLIDDYGYWRGARKAVDEYFNGSLFLSRLDHTGRIAVKP